MKKPLLAILILVFLLSALWIALAIFTSKYLALSAPDAENNSPGNSILGTASLRQEEPTHQSKPTSPEAPIPSHTAPSIYGTDQAGIVQLPSISKNGPHPSGYDEAIAVRIAATNYTHYQSLIQNLVENFSPRHHDVYQIIVDQQTCELGGTSFEKHNLLRALEDAEAKFVEYGYQIIHEPVPDSNGSYNLIAYKPASAVTAAPVYPSVLEVGAHIDTRKTTPGASDNAAGAAGVIEMAGLLKDYPNHHPWRFILFVEEEKGTAGSKVHTQQIKGQPLKIALVMDGIGWSMTEPEPMNCIYDNHAIPYSVEVAQLFDTIRQRYQIGIGWQRCTYSSRFSDQGRYWDEGLPAVLSVGGLPYKDKTLHKCKDNMANLDLNNAFLTVQENVGVFLTLDQQP